MYGCIEMADQMSLDLFEELKDVRTAKIVKENIESLKSM